MLKQTLFVGGSYDGEVRSVDDERKSYNASSIGARTGELEQEKYRRVEVNVMSTLMLGDETVFERILKAYRERSEHK